MADPDQLARLRETLTLAGLPLDGDPRSSLGRWEHADSSAGGRETLPAGDGTAPPLADREGRLSPTTTLESLPPLMLREAGSRRADSPHQFQVLRTIGEGGMGRVELARQPGLDREVAVKRLRSGRSTLTASRALIREARLMGGLEHPNIPPIYTLGRSDDEPVLAMKRIEGVSWAELLGDPEHSYWSELGGDRLTRNIEILMQVCQAAHFAHSHETLHLDIKPDNVMLGRFGEVYLIDWGVARRFEEVAEQEGSPEVGRLVGTPAYMAPEMTTGLLGTSPATDVYLLGATLHEVITGQPRHHADTVLATLLAAKESKPHVYPSQVHEELAQIATRACHAEPARRFGTALELRQALQEYLRLRSSLVLSDAAHQRLSVLRELAAMSVPGKPLSPALHDAFIECRFGFEQALEKAAHNERARAGRHTAYELMIDAELMARSAGAAEALMAALGEADPERRGRLERLREELTRDANAHARLQAIERDLQPRNESWMRSMAIAFGSLMWLVLVGGMGLGARLGWFEITPVHNLGLSVVFLAGGLGALVKRDQFFHNRVIKQITTLIVASGFVMVAGRIAALLLELPLWHSAIADMMLLAMLMGCSEIIIGKLFHGVLMAISLTAAVVVAALAPPYAYEVTGVVMAVLNFKLAWDMRPELEAVSRGTGGS